MERSGTEPANARSPLRLRVVLSVLALVFGTAGAVAFFVAASRSGGTRAGELTAAVICAVTVIVAVIDLVVLSARRDRWRAGRP